MRRLKTALAVIALVAAIGVVNYAVKMDPKHLVERGVGQDHHHHHQEEQEAEEGREGEEGQASGQHHEHHEHSDPTSATPGSLGPEAAPVRLDVFYETDNECMTDFEPLMKKIADHYGDRVRIDFKPTQIEANKQAADELRLGCASGLAINGEVVKKVPGVGEHGLVAFRGPPGQKDYTPAQLVKTIEHELTTKGVEFTPSNGAVEGPQAGAAAGHDHEHHHH